MVSGCFFGDQVPSQKCLYAWIPIFVLDLVGGIQSPSTNFVQLGSCLSQVGDCIQVNRLTPPSCTISGFLKLAACRFGFEVGTAAVLVWRFALLYDVPFVLFLGGHGSHRITSDYQGTNNDK